MNDGEGLRRARDLFAKDPAKLLLEAFLADAVDQGDARRARLLACAAAFAASPRFGALGTLLEDAARGAYPPVPNWEPTSGAHTVLSATAQGTQMNAPQRASVLEEILAHQRTTAGQPDFSADSLEKMGSFDRAIPYVTGLLCEDRVLELFRALFEADRVFVREERREAFGPCAAALLSRSEWEAAGELLLRLASCPDVPEHGFPYSAEALQCSSQIAAGNPLSGRQRELMLSELFRGYDGRRL